MVFESVFNMQQIKLQPYKNLRQQQQKQENSRKKKGKKEKKS